MQLPRASRGVSLFGADRMEPPPPRLYLWARADSGSGRERLVVREKTKMRPRITPMNSSLQKLHSHKVRVSVTILSPPRRSGASYCSSTPRYTLSTDNRSAVGRRSAPCFHVRIASTVSTSYAVCVLAGVRDPMIDSGSI